VCVVVGWLIQGQPPTPILSWHGTPTDVVGAALHTTHRWQEANEPAGGQLAPGQLAAAIVVPIVVGSLLAGALVLFVCRRRARAQAGADGGKGGAAFASAARGGFGATDSAGSHGANGRLLPLVLRDALGLQGASSLSSSKPGGGSASDLAAFAAGPGSDRDRTALQVVSRTSSGGLSSTGIGSRNKSGPSEDIAQVRGAGRGVALRGWCSCAACEGCAAHQPSARACTHMTRCRC
jgi:hypothetical protein